jgi:hypothetical protein
VLQSSSPIFDWEWHPTFVFHFVHWLPSETLPSMLGCCPIYGLSCVISQDRWNDDLKLLSADCFLDNSLISRFLVPPFAVPRPFYKMHPIPYAIGGYQYCLVEICILPFTKTSKRFHYPLCRKQLKLLHCPKVLLSESLRRRSLQSILSLLF